MTKAEALTIAAVEAGVPTLVEAHTLVIGFYEIIRRKAAADLIGWIERSRESLVISFAIDGASNIEAVRAAILSLALSLLRESDGFAVAVWPDGWSCRIGNRGEWEIFLRFGNG